VGLASNSRLSLFQNELDLGRKISVSDITIKIADESSALAFRTKIELTEPLDKLGVSVHETAPILNGKSDSLLIKSLASAIKESTLAVPVDIADPQSVQSTWEALCGAVRPRMQVSVPVSTVQMEYMCHKKPAAMLQTISELVAKCKSLCADVEFIAGDFGRSDRDFLMQTLKAATDAGATQITVCDTAGNLFPEEFYDAVKLIREAVPEGVRLGVWCSNELYMADSSAIAAVRAGADEIKAAAFDKSNVSIKRFCRILEAKKDICKAESSVNTTEINRIIAQIKMLCKAKKGCCPALPSQNSEDSDALALTAHDDQASVMKVVSKLGYDLSEEDAAKVYETFLRLASKNDVVEAKELDAIVASVAFQAPARYKLDSYVINSGNVISATCHMRLLKDDNLLESVVVGDGPVDAAFHALEKLIDRKYELDDFQIQAVTEGREAMGEAVVRLRYAGKVFSGRGISTDIVGSSIMAYINAINKIVYEEEQV